MKQTTGSVFGIVLIVTFAIFPRTVAAQEHAAAPSARPSTLMDEIQELDDQLFGAFNRRDIETQKRIFAKDIEFYHDTGGVTHYDELIRNTERLFAQNSGLRRTLVAGSQEVYPVPNYGAIQIGRHTFCHLENGREDCGTFKFVHVWRNDDGRWQLARVISYGH